MALFSARGPNIKDYSFQDADLLKPDILAPGSLIWAAWTPNGTDEPNYVGTDLTASTLCIFSPIIICGCKLFNVASIR